MKKRQPLLENEAIKKFFTLTQEIIVLLTQVRERIETLTILNLEIEALKPEDKDETMENLIERATQITEEIRSICTTLIQEFNDKNDSEKIDIKNLDRENIGSHAQEIINTMTKMILNFLEKLKELSRKEYGDEIKKCIERVYEIMKEVN